jgi:6-phosphogluconolactonase
MISLPELKIFNHAVELAEAATQHILTAAESAIRCRGQFKIVLAGGSTPNAIYQLLAQAQADWSHWWIFWGDERCLAVDDPERNSLMAQQRWLTQVAIPHQQIFPIPAETGAATAAVAYQSLLAKFLPVDLVLLGMGEDGHTASLFPGHSHDPQQSVHAVYNAPKPPSERVSLSAKTLSAAEQVLFLISGASKQTAFQQWQAGENLPIANIGGEQRYIYIDHAALGK